jgi:hypothetical protein
MGTEKPPLENTGVETQISILPLLKVVAILLIALVIFTKVDFSAESKVPTLSPQEEAKLQKRLKEIDDAEQYALVAIIDGWYPCNHPGRTTFYLLAGEVWKYGTTTKGKFGRYGFNYLEATNVSYIVEFRGTISECLKEEQRKLFNYPYLPENMVRPLENRLPRPPYNSKMQ